MFAVFAIALLAEVGLVRIEQGQLDPWLDRQRGHS